MPSQWRHRGSVVPKLESTQPLPHVLEPRLDRSLGPLRQWLEAILGLDEPSALTC